ILMNTPIINSATQTSGAGVGARSGDRAPTAGGASQPPPQLLSNLAEMRRAVSAANVNHYNVQPVYDIYANVQGRDLAAVAAEVQRAIDAVQPDLPRGSSVVMRGQVGTMNSSFAGLAAGLGFAVLLVYLLMVVNFQSW